MGLFHELDPTIPLKINVSSVKEVVRAQKGFGARIAEIGLHDISEPLVEACRAWGIEVMINAMPDNASVDDASVDDASRGGESIDLREAYRRTVAWAPDKVNLDDAALFLDVWAEMQQEAGPS